MWGIYKSAFKSLPGKIANAAKGMWDGLTSAFITTLNGIIMRWNRFSLDLKFPDKIFGIPLGPLAGKGFTLETPNIPYLGGLARGGTVMPSRGGTLAVIGEAGRSERVEPLDPDGLSKRDKAMISMLTGGGSGGNTINVYPSQGMNESELASIISRQIAFQLRRGGA